MQIEKIYKLLKDLMPKEKFSRSGITGDCDYFNIKYYEENKRVTLTTSVGHARYGRWTQFHITIKDGATKKSVLEDIERYQQYYLASERYEQSYIAGFKEHIQSTGGHKGNPVWMD